MARSEYTIPVKFRHEENGRYRYGYAKTLEPDSRGNIRILYATGRIGSKQASEVIHEPQGFHRRAEQYGNDII
jgi:hypothetical protein